MGTWGPGGPSEGQLEAAKSAALEALTRCCADKDELRKASAKVRQTLACVAFLDVVVGFSSSKLIRGLNVGCMS